MEDWLVAWDDPDHLDGNVAHIAEHGLTPDEVEDVLLNSSLEIVGSAATKRPGRFGRTTTGRYIVVFWDIASDEPHVVYPVTA
jgi:hypothetical protein